MRWLCACKNRSFPGPPLSSKGAAKSDSPKGRALPPGRHRCLVCHRQVIHFLMIVSSFLSRNETSPNATVQSIELLFNESKPIQCDGLRSTVMDRERTNLDHGSNRAGTELMHSHCIRSHDCFNSMMPSHPFSRIKRDLPFQACTLQLHPGKIVRECGNTRK